MSFIQLNKANYILLHLQLATLPPFSDNEETLAYSMHEESSSSDSSSEKEELEYSSSSSDSSSEEEDPVEDLSSDDSDCGFVSFFTCLLEALCIFNTIVLLAIILQSCNMLLLCSCCLDAMDYGS